MPIHLPVHAHVPLLVRYTYLPKIYPLIQAVWWAICSRKNFNLKYLHKNLCILFELSHSTLIILLEVGFISTPWQFNVKKNYIFITLLVFNCNVCWWLETWLAHLQYLLLYELSGNSYLSGISDFQSLHISIQKKDSYVVHMKWLHNSLNIQMCRYQILSEHHEYDTIMLVLNCFFLPKTRKQKNIQEIHFHWWLNCCHE